MCDPHCRTQYGFQGLVQKEWVTVGHRFYSRVNYHRDNDKEEVRGRDMWGLKVGLLLSFVHLLIKINRIPAGARLPALPGLCVAAALPVSLSLPADKRLPVGIARQHPPAALLQLPGQLPAGEMQTLPGTGHPSWAVASRA